MNGPNVPDDDAVMMSYGTPARRQMIRFRGFCQKNGIDAEGALAAIDAITDAFEDNVKDMQKQEMKRQEQEAPIHDAMQLQEQSVKSPYITDDDNEALQQTRDEDEWGRQIRDGRMGDERHVGKPVVASYEPVQFDPPLTTANNIKRAVTFTKQNEHKFTAQARKIIWRGISNAAKNLSYKDNEIEMKRIEYELEPTFDENGYAVKDMLYNITAPLTPTALSIKTPARCKDPENCDDPSHDHQFYVEGFVTSPIKDLQGEIVSDRTLPEISKAIITPPTNNGWLDHESPYAKPQDNQATPPIIHFEKSAVKQNPYVNKMGVWIRGVLNKEHPRWRNVWNELKSGTYNAFSMEFMPVHEAKEWIGKELTNVVDQIKYLSTSLVRAPANQGAVITNVYAKSFRGVGYSRSSSPTGGVDERKGERTLSQNKDLGRETGTTAPERSNTAIGEWGDPTLEKGQAQLMNSRERMSALNKLKPQDTSYHPSPRRATGAQGKAVPQYDTSQVEPQADKPTKLRPRPGRSQQEPEDYKAVRREEEDEDGYSYEPSRDASGGTGVAPEPLKFEEEEEDEEANAGRVGPVQNPSAGQTDYGYADKMDEEMKMEKAYAKYLKRTTPNRTREQQKALRWLQSKFPTMPLAQAMKAAGEMTDIMGEVNAPQKVKAEQKPPEVNYGKYGEPDVVPPLATFSATVNDIATKAVTAQLKEMENRIVEDLKRYGPRTIIANKRGFGAENTVRDKSVMEASAEPNEDEHDIETMVGRTFGVYQ